MKVLEQLKTNSENKKWYKNWPTICNDRISQLKYVLAIINKLSNLLNDFVNHHEIHDKLNHLMLNTQILFMKLSKPFAKNLHELITTMKSLNKNWSPIALQKLEHNMNMLAKSVATNSMRTKLMADLVDFDLDVDRIRMAINSVKGASMENDHKNILQIAIESGKMMDKCRDEFQLHGSKLINVLISINSIFLDEKEDSMLFTHTNYDNLNAEYREVKMDRGMLRYTADHQFNWFEEWIEFVDDMESILDALFDTFDTVFRLKNVMQGKHFPGSEDISINIESLIGFLKISIRKLMTIYNGNGRKFMDAIEGLITEPADSKLKIIEQTFKSFEKSLKMKIDHSTTNSKVRRDVTSFVDQVKHCFGAGNTVCDLQLINKLANGVISNYDNDKYDFDLYVNELNKLIDKWGELLGSGHGR